MSGWDAIFGEAALGLDLAEVDSVRDGAGRALARRGGRSSVLTRPDPHQDRPTGLAVAIVDAERAGVRARPPQGAQPAQRPLQLASRPAAVTIDPDTIFRQEALELRAPGQDTPGGVVGLGSRWIKWAYRVTVGLLAATIASSWIISTNESASGSAVVDGRTGTVAVLLPVAAGPDLTGSQRLTVGLPGGRFVRISGLHGQLADDTAIRKAGLVPPTQPAILVTGDWIRAHPPGRLRRPRTGCGPGA